ncbi:7256_t:CDS:2, partial [Acaulospora colombiana]
AFSAKGEQLISIQSRLEENFRTTNRHHPVPTLVAGLRCLGQAMKEKETSLERLGL